MWNVYLLAFFTVFLTFTHAEVEFTSQVTTKLGVVRGTIFTSVQGTQVDAFRGIRYGSAGRFEMPQPVTAWQGVYDATSVRYTCPQKGKTLGTGNEQFVPVQATSEYSSEDCLFLNVWRPTKASDTPRAVMVWIHGGGFINGSSFEDIYDGRHLAALGDVVIVSFNYRLGPLGFLSAGNENIVPANLGLYDQLLAIKWVKDNIDAFGGDANKVTIFGESAGSISVGTLIISPLTKGLFQRAIMQSASPLAMDWYDSADKAEKKFQNYAKFVDCEGGDNTKLVECLKTKPVEQLMEEAHKSRTVDNDATPEYFFVPTYNTKFLPSMPAELTLKYNEQIDLLYGVTHDEGTMFVKLLIETLNKRGVELNYDTFPEFVSKLTRSFGYNDYKPIADYYRKFVTKTSPVDDFKKLLGNVWGDYIIVCPQLYFCQKMKTKLSSNVYAYVFQHSTKIPFWGCVEDWQGACHGVDLIYMFGTPLSHPNTFKPEEVQLAKEMIQAWTRFAKTGNPSKVYDVEWKPSVSDEVDYLHIQVGNTKMATGFFKDRCVNFWKPKIGYF